MGAHRSIAKVRGWVAAGLLVALAAPATAQMSDGYSFLKAVRERDAQKAIPLLDKNGGVVNTRDYSTGETGLIIATKARDQSWMALMLMRGGTTELKDRDGDTALTIAARMSFIEGVRMLLSVGTPVNQSNDKGETPLILAVQQRDLPMVRFLVANGADPKITDRIAGKSAHDYAAEDARAQPILRLLDAAKPAAPVAGPPRP